MKSINKNKPISAKKSNKTNDSPVKQSHRYDSQSNQRLDQMFEFHLKDEEPQSIMAKRKLEEYSVQLDGQTGVNTFKRNQNSINMHRKSRNDGNPTEGWVEDELTSTQKSQSETASKHKRSQSASQCTIRQTLKIRTQNEKKFSFASTNPLSQSKLNLSFNNLSPFHMETIPETELCKQLVKKVKSYSSRRPITASYYGASQKVLTLFEKESPTKRNKCETMRIHSNKEVDPKVLGWKENRFLKTFSFNAINKSVSRSKRDSKKLDNFADNETNQKENYQRASSQAKNQRKSHTRIHSEITDYQGSNDNLQQQGYGQYSHRKLTIMTQKRHILNKRIKSYQNITPSIQQDGRQKIRQSFSRQSNLIGSNKRMSTNKIQSNFQISIKQQPSQVTSHSPSPNKHLPNPMPSNLQQDFSLLISMLKHQSQHIFGGQLHSYLTQMKNNSLYNYYCSGGGNKKKNSRKLVLNTTTGRGNRKQKGKVSEHDRMRGLIEEKQVKRNNRDVYYTGLSQVRDKDELSTTGQFVRTSNDGFYHQN